MDGADAPDMPMPPPPPGMMAPDGPPKIVIKRMMMGGTGGMMGEGRMFDMADANKDGKVTESEALTSALARFDQADTNKDGKFTPDERRERRVEIRKVMKDRRATPMLLELLQQSSRSDTALERLRQAFHSERQSVQEQIEATLKALGQPVRFDSALQRWVQESSV